MSAPVTINVVVHATAVAEPFHDPHAAADETVGHLRTRVLQAFELSDDPSYRLQLDKKDLTDMTVTLGQLAGPGRSLQLKLLKQVTQGAS